MTNLRRKTREVDYGTVISGQTDSMSIKDLLKMITNAQEEMKRRGGRGLTLETCIEGYDDYSVYLSYGISETDEQMEKRAAKIERDRVREAAAKIKKTEQRKQREVARARKAVENAQKRLDKITTKK